MHDATTMNDDDVEGDGEVIKKPQSTEVGGDLNVEMADNDKRDREVRAGKKRLDIEIRQDGKAEEELLAVR